MQATIEVFGPQGQTLYVNLYSLTAQTPVAADVPATEWIPTRYRATIESIVAGKYHLLLKNADGFVVNSSQVTLEDTAAVQYAYDPQSRLEAKLDYVAPDAPVITLPAPTDATQTIAWARCYSSDGRLQPNVRLEIKAQAPAKAAHGVFASTSVVASSNGDGVVTINIPRVAGLRFLARTEQGEWVPFVGVNAPTIELPAMVG